MKQFLKGRSLSATLIMLGSFAGAATGAVVQFDLEFFDANSALIGTGTYRFDDIPTDTPAPFSILTSFSWEVQIPSLSIFISSAAGDTPTEDSYLTEGIVLTGTAGSRSLQFFDNAGLFVLHRDRDESFPSGVEFRGSTNTVLFYDNGSSVGSGSFAAVEAIPEPTTGLLLGLASLGLLVRRRG